MGCRRLPRNPAGPSVVQTLAPSGGGARQPPPAAAGTRQDEDLRFKCRRAAELAQDVLRLHALPAEQLSGQRIRGLMAARDVLGVGRSVTDWVRHAAGDRVRNGQELG